MTIQTSHFAEQVAGESKDLKLLRSQHVNRPSSEPLEYQPNPAFLGLSSVDQNPILTGQVIAHLIATDNQFTYQLRQQKEQQRLNLDQAEVSLSTTAQAASQSHDSRYRQLGKIVERNAGVVQDKGEVPGYLTMEKLKETQNSQLHLHPKKLVKSLKDIRAPTDLKEKIKEIKQQNNIGKSGYAAPVDLTAVKAEQLRVFRKDLKDAIDDRDWVGEVKEEPVQVGDQTKKRHKKKAKTYDMNLDGEDAEPVEPNAQQPVAQEVTKETTKEDSDKKRRRKEKSDTAQTAPKLETLNEDDLKLTREPQWQPPYQAEVLDDLSDQMILDGLTSAAPVINSVQRSGMDYEFESATVEKLAPATGSQWKPAALSALERYKPSSMLLQGQNAFAKKSVGAREDVDGDVNRMSMSSGVTPYRPLGYDKGVTRESYAGSQIGFGDNHEEPSRRESQWDQSMDDFLLDKNEVVPVESGDQHTNDFQRREPLPKTEPVVVEKEETQTSVFKEKSAVDLLQLLKEKRQEAKQEESDGIDWKSVRDDDFETSDKQRTVEVAAVAAEEEEEIELEANEQEEEQELELEPAQYDEKTCFYCKAKGDSLDYLDTHKVLKRFIEKNSIHVLDDVLDVPVDIPENFFLHVVQQHMDYFHKIGKQDVIDAEYQRFQQLQDQLKRQRTKIIGCVKPAAYKASKFNFGNLRSDYGKKLTGEKENLYQTAVKKDERSKSKLRDEWRYSAMNSDRYSKRLQVIVKGLQEKGKM